MHLINELVDKSTGLIADGGPLVGFFLVLLESFIPMLPLSVIVTLNINAFGFFFGVLISWLATCIGCITAYTLFYNLSNKFIRKYLSQKTRNKIDKNINKFKKIHFSSLVLILTLPFTPSFLINILAGGAAITKEKYILSLLIGKLFMVTFWGYIGKSLIESLTDIKAIIFIALALLLAYIISKIVSKKMNIE